MSRLLRFIAVALVAWVGVRAISLGMVPGAEAFAFDRPGARAPAADDAAALPAVAATEFAPIDPLVPATLAAAPGIPGEGYLPAPPPYSYPAAGGYAPAHYASYPRQERPAFAGSSRPARALDFEGVGDWSLEPGPARYSRTTPLDQWPLAQIASAAPASAPAAQSIAQSPAEVRPRSTACR